MIHSVPAAGGRVVDWLSSEANQTSFSVQRIPLQEMRRWQFQDGDLRHDSGKFFAVTGAEVRTLDGDDVHYTQPILDQPEVGLLAIVVTRTAEGWCFLMQGKAEPGNIGDAQLSPTVQATQSNMKRVHGGQPPPYIDLLVNAPAEWVVVDVLQPEYGTRFLRKRNRNLVIEVPRDHVIRLEQGFAWFTQDELAEALRRDNTVNAEARSVLGCLPPWFHLTQDCAVGRSGDDAAGSSTDAEVDEWLSAAQGDKRGTMVRRRLDELAGWTVGRDTIYRPEGSFRVVGLRCSIAGREVLSWDQPIVEPLGVGFAGLAVREHAGLLEVLARVEWQVGEPEQAHLAPTLRSSLSADVTPLIDLLGRPQVAAVRSDSFHSGEGGRFFRAQTRYVVLQLPDDHPAPGPAFRWLTLRQLHRAVLRGVVTSELRSHIADLSTL